MQLKTGCSFCRIGFYTFTKDYNILQIKDLWRISKFRENPEGCKIFKQHQKYEESALQENIYNSILERKLWMKSRFFV